MTDAGSSPAASIQGARQRRPRHALVQHMIPLLGKGHNGDFTLKIGEDSTILGVHEIMDPEKRRGWRLAMLVLEDMHSLIVPWHFVIKGITERIELPGNGAWNCVATVQSRSGYVWAIFQVWPEEGA